jgi:aldehyde:ferredoxin oxidoreductase
VIIAMSPLVGTALTTSAKFAVVCHSPLTGRINDSLASSGFALAGKRTGYDAFVIVGAAARWSCLLIEPGGVRFLPADELSGLSSAQTEEKLRAGLGADARALAIGIAGERRVRFATVSHDGRHAGRGGSGAVMGSKRLKAVIVRGDRQVELFDAPAVAKYAKELSSRSFGPATAKYRELGTVANLLVFNRLGALPTRNFQAGQTAQAEALAPEALSHGRAAVRESCAACTIGCEHIFELAPGAAKVRMEYENLFALGPLCGVHDPQTVLRASEACDRLGMDTISAGAAAAFAMECAERGLIDAPQLRFGNGEALVALLEQMALAQGLGGLLAQGTRRAARAIGQGAEQFAPHVKGLEIPGYEPRALQSMALGFAVAARGADHNRSGAYQVDFSEAVDRLAPGPEVILQVIATEDEAAVMDSLILCKFLRGVFADKLLEMANMLRMVTGWPVTAGELQETARRIVAARKYFNVRQGWSPAEDTLPDRFFEQPLPDGQSAGACLDRARLGQLIEGYNLARGYCREGFPGPAQIAELMLDEQVAGAALGAGRMGT